MVIHRNGWRQFRAHFVIYIYIYGLVLGYWKCVIRLSYIFEHIVNVLFVSLKGNRKAE